MIKDEKYYPSIVRELQKLPKETLWVEFKVDYVDLEDIGQYISALANSATLADKPNAYMVWGISDTDHTLVGTKFKPHEIKKGNEELENWLLRFLEPKIHFEFHEIEIDEKKIVLLEINQASHQPVQFQNIEYIRVGSYKKKLKDHPEKAKKLWSLFDQTSFEEQIAVSNIEPDDVFRLIDYPSFFDLIQLSLPENRNGILERLKDYKMIVPNDSGKWSITNLGAILFAKKLGDFRKLARKTIRVIVYRGNTKIETIKEQEGTKGYACGYEGLIQYINNLIPMNEIIEQALRKNVPMYPELAIRELIVNAIIHQDFTISGTGPMVEIFSDRMEITNPGKPLVDTNRFLDSPARSRNELLASFLRKIGVCEERGTGIDKVVSQTELYQLPAPVFEVTQDHTRAILFAHRPFNKMDKADRVRACYLHSCLKSVERDFMTNSSLRQRFGIEDHNIAIASRIIRDTVDAGLVRQYDPEQSRKYTKYVPFWA